jgi:hypothetical protein
MMPTRHPLSVRALRIRRVYAWWAVVATLLGMRHSLAFALALALTACGSDFEAAQQPVDGTGGAPEASGGSPSTGGTIATGGVAQATGGLPVSASGGAPATGAAPTIATGGSATATGGAPTVTGGASATGGALPAATGGFLATGGVAATGGAPQATGGASAATSPWLPGGTCPGSNVAAGCGNRDGCAGLADCVNGAWGRCMSLGYPSTSPEGVECFRSCLSSAASCPR